MNILLNEAKHTFNEGTRIETKVVRVILGEVVKDSIGCSRGAIYSKVLASAHQADVISKRFIKSLKEQDGVEAVRKPSKGKTPLKLKLYVHSKHMNNLHQSLKLTLDLQRQLKIIPLA